MDPLQPAQPMQRANLHRPDNSIGWVRSFREHEYSVKKTAHKRIASMVHPDCMVRFAKMRMAVMDARAFECARIRVTLLAANHHGCDRA